LAARDRAERLLLKIREQLVNNQLEVQGVDPSILKPFAVHESNVAPPQASQAAFWSKLLPFVMLIWALTGAFYPAIDLVAGEKERGTLETLLCSPALRGEIVWGKLLAVASFSVATALLNVAGLELTMSFVSRQLAVGPMGSAGMPPPETLGWLVLALIPLSFLFSALALSVAALARSSKEAQYYLMPLLMVMMPLVILPVLNGMELNLGTALIPVTGMFLLVRTLVEQHYLHGLMHMPFVAGVTAGCCWMAMRWAKHQFEHEQVLFRADDQGGLGTWVRRMMHDRQETPSPALSFSCGMGVLMLLFFARMTMSKPPTEWQAVAVTILAPQLGLVLFPALLLATLFTTRIRKSLLIHRGPWLMFPAAVLLAFLLHPTYVALTQLISHFYPVSFAMRQALGSFEQVLMTPAFWQVALVLGVIPALCEELCFRGFGLAGMLKIGRPWVAVIVTAVLFGMSHGILQQSLAASVMGIVLGILAWRTGSVLPGILFHVTHNSLSLWMGRITYEGLEPLGAWRWIAYRGVEGISYQPMWTLLSAALACGLLYYFWTIKSLYACRPTVRVGSLRLGESRDFYSSSSFDGSGG
jgi:sodium transport system permease protein